jgi:hypothetical protein
VTNRCVVSFEIASTLSLHARRHILQFPRCVLEARDVPVKSPVLRHRRRRRSASVHADGSERNDALYRPSSTPRLRLAFVARRAARARPRRVRGRARVFQSSSAPASRSRSRASLVSVTNLQRDVVDL